MKSKNIDLDRFVLTLPNCFFAFRRKRQPLLPNQFFTYFRSRISHRISFISAAFSEILALNANSSSCEPKSANLGSYEPELVNLGFYEMS